MFIPDDPAPTQPIRSNSTEELISLAGGTGNQIIEEKERALKEARKRETLTGQAQVGTPLGDDYGNARCAVEAAERDLNNARARWS